MKVTISYRQVNAAYDHDYAKQNHGGKESDGNRKYNREEVIKINGNVKAVNVIDDDDFTWMVKQADGKEVPYKVPNMQVVQCFMDSGDIQQYAVSAALIDPSHKTQKVNGNRTFYYFNLNQDTDYINSGSGVIIAKADFPKELMVRR